MLNDQTLFFGLPIKIDENVTLYQPTLNEMIEQGFMIENILEPFITLDKRNFENEENNDKINNFDMLFVQLILAYMQYLDTEKDNINKLTLSNWINSDKSNILVIKRLIEVIKFLCKTDDVALYMENIVNGTLDTTDKNYILINKSYKINRDNFEDFKNLVCEILDTEIKIEKKPQKKSEEEDELLSLFEKKKAEYEKKYKKKPKKDKNKDNLTIFTLINYIIHYKDTQYNYDTIRNLTIYQIKNTFKYYQNQEMYELDMKYRTSGNFKMDKKTSEHWFFDK
jgi:hypothetical protein